MNIDHEKLYRTWGMYFRYPQCCIEAFVDRGDNFILPTGTPYDGTGFIPCKRCHHKVKDLDLTQANFVLGLDVRFQNADCESLFIDALNRVRTEEFDECADIVGFDKTEYVKFLEDGLQRY